MIRLKLISPSQDNECRCYECNKLLAKIKFVDNVSVIEIKCTRAKCGTLNVFRIEKNPEYNEHTARDQIESSPRAAVRLQGATKM